MAKKLLVFALAAIMMLGIFGLTGCDNISLADYKVTKTTELQSYADAKGQSNYSESGWTSICKAVTDGKAAIEAAKSKPAVTTAYNQTKDVIDAEEREGVEMGKFYSLQEAYDEKFLKVEDLQSIAHYYSLTVVDGGSNNDESFIPKSKTPETLTEETKNKIKQTYLNDLQKTIPEAKLNNISISYYYGTYGDCVVVNVWDDCMQYDLLFVPEQFIGGVLFRNYCARTIYVWIVE